MTKEHNLNKSIIIREHMLSKEIHLPNCNMPIETVSRKQVVNFELSLF